MTQDLEAILHTALSLPAEKRAALAEKLLDSLDENRAEIEAAWADEAESRIRAFEQGALKKFSELCNLEKSGEVLSANTIAKINADLLGAIGTQ
ncbi:MAG TPA: addiction module protein [Gemmataceae bacterium]|nr:addiction module protein [Gemmataceae bacterium]